LGVEGEWMEKVAYKLLEPELIKEKNILVVGGGDSAIESALLLAEDNKVTLSYRSDNFSRLKPKNAENINKAIENGLVITLFESNVINIIPDKVEIRVKDGETLTLDNDLVYIFAGGELPTQFLEKSGIKISKDLIILCFHINIKYDWSINI
jgi:thioredoxin reductase (NADPH)